MKDVPVTTCLIQGTKKTLFVFCRDPATWTSDSIMALGQLFWFLPMDDAKKLKDFVRFLLDLSEIVGALADELLVHPGSAWNHTAFSIILPITYMHRKLFVIDQAGNLTFRVQWPAE
jgi:hypothetical protein